MTGEFQEFETRVSRCRRLILLLFASLLFVSILLGSRWWFDPVLAGARDSAIVLEPLRSLPGYDFMAEPLQSSIAEVLATTNLINGVFKGAAGAFVRIFMARWEAESNTPVDVVHHTPDLCWINSGWVPISTTIPPRVEVMVGTNRIPFEARVFGVKGTVHQELVIWTTLLDGVPVGDFHGLFKRDSDIDTYKASASRKRKLGQFLDMVMSRVPASGAKQFVRISTKWNGDETAALEQLRRFALAWLRVSRMPKGTN